MAVLNARITDLEAVNDMLLSIGEAPVNNLNSGLPDAELAERVLGETSRQVQLKGWHVNTSRAVKLVRDSDNMYNVGVDALRVDTANPRGRMVARPPSSAHINVSVRRNIGNTKFILFDVANNTETWTTPTSLTVDIVVLIPFDTLTPALQLYIAKLAGRKFQTGVMGSQVLREFTQVDIDEALEDAMQEDAENEDYNLILDSPHVFDIAYRNNPGFGR